MHSAGQLASNDRIALLSLFSLRSRLLLYGWQDIMQTNAGNHSCSHCFSLGLVLEMMSFGLVLHEGSISVFRDEYSAGFLRECTKNFRRELAMVGSEINAQRWTARGEAVSLYLSVKGPQAPELYDRCTISVNLENPAEIGAHGKIQV